METRTSFKISKYELWTELVQVESELSPTPPSGDHSLLSCGSPSLPALLQGPHQLPSPPRATHSHSTGKWVAPCAQRFGPPHFSFITAYQYPRWVTLVTKSHAAVGFPWWRLIIQGTCQGPPGLIRKDAKKKPHTQPFCCNAWSKAAFTVSLINFILCSAWTLQWTTDWTLLFSSLRGCKVKRIHTHTHTTKGTIKPLLWSELNKWAKRLNATARQLASPPAGNTIRWHKFEKTSIRLQTRKLKHYFFLIAQGDDKRQCHGVCVCVWSLNSWQACLHACCIV